MRSTNLAPNPDHLAAALSYHRAANCLRHARLSPWTAERELDSAKFWIGSAQHYRQMAAFNKTQVVRHWAPVGPSWRDEVNWLMRSSAQATLAGVE